MSDNGKARGKHCTTWAVTACHFTSRKRITLLTWEVKWHLFESSHRLYLTQRPWWVLNIWWWLLLLGAHLLKSYRKNIVSHYLLISWSICSDSVFLTGIYPSNPLKRVFDSEGGGDMLWKSSRVYVTKSIVLPFQHKSEKCPAFRAIPRQAGRDTSSCSKGNLSFVYWFVTAKIGGLEWRTERMYICILFSPI